MAIFFLKVVADCFCHYATHRPDRSCLCYHLGSGRTNCFHAGKEKFAVVRDSSMEGSQALKNAKQGLLHVHLYAYAHMMTCENEDKRAFDRKIEQYSRQLAQSLDTIERLIVSDEDRKLLEADKSDIKDFLALINDSVLPKSRANEQETARELLDCSRQSVSALLTFGEQTTRPKRYL